MNINIKNTLGIALILAAVGIVGSLASLANSYSRSVEPSTFRSFTVSAEGEAIGIPDVALFSAGVITEGGKNIADLQAENTRKTNDIIAFAKESGVEEKDIKTISYSISPRYEACNNRFGRICPPPRIIGYTINSVIEIRVRDFAKAGDILSGVVDKGANTVSGLSFEIDNQDAVLKIARDEAIAEAKVKAQEIAASAGFRIGRLLSIQESHMTPFQFRAEPMREMMTDAVAVPRPAVTIDPGSQELSVSITLTYEIR